jgi:hypothetical protein
VKAKIKDPAAFKALYWNTGRQEHFLTKNIINNKKINNSKSIVMQNKKLDLLNCDKVKIEQAAAQPK